MTTYRRVSTSTSIGLATWLVSIGCGLGQEATSVLQREAAIVDPPLVASTQETLPAPNSNQETSVLKPQQEVPEGVELLTKGTLHEAFAEVYQSNPRPNPIVQRKPPEPINELPPEYKPDGENIEWIPGYWVWDDDRTDFVWLSGVWRDIPPGQRWVPGYWENLPDGFRWVNGFWMKDEIEEISYLPEPPQSLDNGPSSAAPSESHFYAPGNWVYQSDQYVWQPGYWMPRIENWIWIPPTYVWTPGGCVFRPGFWDREFDSRGVAFAPIGFQAPIYQQPSFFYTPTCVINTNFNLFPHLFVRPNCNRYFFGDWYGNQYVHQNFCAWSQLSFQPQFNGFYDPMFVYYSGSNYRYQNLSLMIWARNQNNFCSFNQGFRPGPTFNLNINIQKNNFNGSRHSDGHNHDSDGHNHAQIAETLEQRVKNNSGSVQGRGTLRQVAENERQNLKKSADPLRNLASERRNHEAQKTSNPPKDVRIASTNSNNEKVQQPKLVLPKVERKEVVSAQRAEIQLKREQAQKEVAAKQSARQLEKLERPNSNRNEVPLRAQFNQPIVDRSKDSQSNGKVTNSNERSPTQNATNQVNPNPVLRSTGDKQAQRRSELDAKLADAKLGQEQRESQRDIEKQQAAQQRSVQQQVLQQKQEQRQTELNQQRSSQQRAQQAKEVQRSFERQQEQQQRVIKQQQPPQFKQQQQQMELNQQRSSQQQAQQAKEVQRSFERQQAQQQRVIKQQQPPQFKQQQQPQQQMRQPQQQVKQQQQRVQRESPQQQRQPQRESGGGGKRGKK